MENSFGAGDFMWNQLFYIFLGVAALVLVVGRLQKFKQKFSISRALVSICKKCCSLIS